MARAESKSVYFGVRVDCLGRLSHQVRTRKWMLVFRDDFFGEVTNEEAERIV